MGSEIRSISTIDEGDRVILLDFMIKYRDRFWASVSSYAQGRSEWHLKYWASLSKGHARPSTPHFLKQFDPGELNQVYGVLNAIYGGNHWDSALCLWYSAYRNAGRLPKMDYHRDHKLYEEGAVMINLSGRGVFYTCHSKTPNDTEYTHRLEPGTVIDFNNKRLHKIDIATQERAAILLFRIKPKHKLTLEQERSRQLSLF